MMSSAKLLTWVEDVRSLSNLRNSLKEWLCEMNPQGRDVLGLWGGKIIAQRPYLAVASAIQPYGKIIDLDDKLDALRLHKSPRELELLREACRILAAASGAFERAAADDSGARSAALAAERAAFANGAQDVRILASARNGGPPLPLDGPDDLRVAPLLACISVRFSGYWAEGLVTVPDEPNGAHARAVVTLTAMLREARSGTTSIDLFRVARQHLPPYKFHPLVESVIGNGIGLSFEESPSLGRGEKSLLEEGGVYTLRCGALGEGSDNAVLSAMIAVNGTGINILWPTTGHSGSEGSAQGAR
jgi:Xaa-Pro aminopeptidase